MVMPLKNDEEGNRTRGRAVFVSGMRRALTDTARTQVGESCRNIQKQSSLKPGGVIV